MAQTTTSTLTTVIPSEYISAKLLQEARPFNVAAPLIQNVIMPMGSGKVWNQSQIPAGTAATVAEASDITAAARTTTENSLTIGEVGLSTEITDISMEIAKVAGDLLTWAGMQGRAVAQKLTGDVCALFASLNGSTPVGSTGTNITVANFIEAMYTLDNNNAPGQKNSVLHPRQVADLFNAISSSTGTPFASLQELVRQGRLPEGTPAAGFQGLLFGVPVYSTTEVPTANSAADRAGGMFVRDAMAFVQLRAVRTKYERDESKRSTEIVVTTAYAVGETVDTYGVAITTDA